MRSFSWVHLVLAILIIVFATLEYNSLVILLAAIIAILSIFGVCSCGVPRKSAPAKTMKSAPIKRKRK